MKSIKKICLMILTIAFVIVGSVVFTACGSKKLETPKNIVFNVTEKTIAFDEVKDATSYIITVYRAVEGGDDIEVESIRSYANAAQLTFTQNWAGVYYAQVQAVSENVKISSSETGKSANDTYHIHADPMFRIVKSARASASQTAPGAPNYVWIQLNPAQAKAFYLYGTAQTVDGNIEFKIYSGTAATGTPLLTKTVAGSSLSVTESSDTYTASAGFTFDVSSTLSALGSYTITAQTKASTVGTDSSLNTYTYNYTAHGTSVTNTNAGTYTAVTGYTFTNPA